MLQPHSPPEILHCIKYILTGWLAVTRWIEAVIIRQGTIYPTNELGILNLFGKNVELFNIHQLSGEILPVMKIQLKCKCRIFIIKVSNEHKIKNYNSPEYLEMRTCKVAKLRDAGREKLSFVSSSSQGRCGHNQLAVISSVAASKVKWRVETWLCLLQINGGLNQYQSLQWTTFYFQELLSVELATASRCRMIKFYLILRRYKTRYPKFPRCWYPPDIAL